MKNYTLSERGYDYLAKGILLGISIGITTGIIFNKIILLSSTFTLIGIISSITGIIIKRNLEK